MVLKILEVSSNNNNTDQMDMRCKIECSGFIKYAVMASQNNCWGARAVNMLTVSGVQESLQRMPIVLPKMTK